MIDIRPATADDLPRIEQIYDAIHTAEETGAASVGWARGVYPTRATAQAALDDGALFVLEDDGVLVAAGRIDQVQVPVYAQVPWQYAAPPEQVLVLHTLVVDPTIAGALTARQFDALLGPARPRARLHGAAHRHECKKRRCPPALRPSRLPRGRHRAVHLQRHRRRKARLSGKTAGRRMTQSQKTAARGHIPRAAVFYKTRYWRSSSTRCAPTRRLSCAPVCLPRVRR